ncbi:hypothetical protein OPV22_014295 [Ensete ventricosum]|uniref:Uncharacterized protein n=1 Tax=Ensete ventricosum TaxID=4639 RepID=A0AAV8PPX1_ENSVE|nr:hypothetical protein OPV22_014295 [Ensete ventricosum]
MRTAKTSVPIRRPAAVYVLLLAALVFAAIVVAIQSSFFIGEPPLRREVRGADKCYNRSICEEHLNLILPAKPPFHPQQFQTCAVVGNSGDLFKTEFGFEIDGHDAVFRDNDAPVNEKYAKHVGLKRDFRLVVRGAARNMVAILDGSSEEVLIIKSVTHRDFNAKIKEGWHNPSQGRAYYQPLEPPLV